MPVYQQNIPVTSAPLKILQIYKEQYSVCDLPEGHSSVLHLPYGQTVPATKVWVRHNSNGKTVHAYPME